MSYNDSPDVFNRIQIWAASRLPHLLDFFSFKPSFSLITSVNAGVVLLKNKLFASIFFLNGIKHNFSTLMYSELFILQDVNAKFNFSVAQNPSQTIKDPLPKFLIEKYLGSPQIMPVATKTIRPIKIKLFLVRKNHLVLKTKIFSYLDILRIHENLISNFLLVPNRVPCFCGRIPPDSVCERASNLVLYSFLIV